jgi:hypothetical protein
VPDVSDVRHDEFRRGGSAKSHSPQSRPSDCEGGGDIGLSSADWCVLMERERGERKKKREAKIFEFSVVSCCKLQIVSFFFLELYVSLPEKDKFVVLLSLMQLKVLSSKERV